MKFTNDRPFAEPETAHKLLENASTILAGTERAHSHLENRRPFPFQRRRQPGRIRRWASWFAIAKAGLAT